MSTAGHTPNFIAQETVYPFRVVQFGSNAFSLLHATQSDEVLAGVTDGSVQGFNATTHATAGQVCSLQNGEFVQVTAGDTIVPADLLVATTDGKVIPAQLGSTEAILQAAEAAEDGEILWCKKIGAWTLGGGVSPITGGAWPDPSAKALWSCEFTGTIPLFNDINTDPVFLPGPDFYYSVFDGSTSVIEQNYFPFTNHMGVVDVSCSSFGTNANWMVVGNAPATVPVQFNIASLGGRPGVDIRYNNNEFVVIWKPYSYLNVPGGVTWKVWAGCSEAGISYPDDAAEPTIGFFFRASPANENWECVQRFINTSTLAAVEYTQDSEVPINTGTAAWRNMKVLTVASATPGAYPTIEYYIDGVLVNTFDVNTVPSNIRSSINDVPLFAMMGAFVDTYEDGTRWVTSQLDYMHMLTTFTTPR